MMMWIVSQIVKDMAFDVVAIKHKLGRFLVSQ